MNRLHALRKAKKVTLEQLSDETDISIASLSRYETGKRNPKISTIRTLAEYFEVSSDYLEGRDSSTDTVENIYDLSNIFYQLRISNGLNQGDVAKQVGITRQAISLYERGEREPKYSDAYKLLKIFGKRLVVEDL